MISTSPAVLPSTRPPARRRGPRPRFTDAEIADIVRRHETETGRSIAYSYKCHPATVIRIVRLHGGKKAASCKRGKPLTDDERAYIIDNYRKQTLAAISRHLGRSLKAVRECARAAGVAPPRVRRVDGERLVVGAEQYKIERAKRLVQTTREIHSLCDQIGIPVDDTPLVTLARTLKRYCGWRPANIHVAADLGDDGLFLPRPASEPCEALAGSLERVQAYAARVERGEEIWCERDRRD